MEHPVDVVLGTCLIVLNLTAFFTYGWDTCRAKKGQWRVPEHTLLALAFAPKVLLLFDNKGAMTVIVPFIGKYSPKLGTSGAGTVTTEGTSVTWYAANAADQMNSSGVTYTYVAIG